MFHYYSFSMLINVMLCSCLACSVDLIINLSVFLSFSLFLMRIYVWFLFCGNVIELCSITHDHSNFTEILPFQFQRDEQTTWAQLQISKRSCSTKGLKKVHQFYLTANLYLLKIKYRANISDTFLYIWNLKKPHLLKTADIKSEYWLSLSTQYIQMKPAQMHSELPCLFLIFFANQKKICKEGKGREN